MTAAFLVAGLFVLGGALILLAGLIPAARSTARELWSFYVSEFLIVGAVLLSSAAGVWPFALLLALAAARGQYEMFDLFGQPIGLLQKIAMGTGAVFGALGLLAPGWLPMAVGGAALLFMAASLILHAGWRAMLLATGSLVFPVIAIALTGLLRGSGQGFLWLFLAQGVVETNDSFALVLGKLIGRTRPFPNLSPRKTLAGLVCGALAGAGIGFVIAHRMLKLSVVESWAAVVVCLLAGLAGDLLLSALKRARGRKDFKPLALIHGGLLDIYDSLLFAAPALLALKAVLALLL